MKISPPPTICPACVKGQAHLSADASVAILYCEHNITGAVYRFDQQNWISWSPMSAEQFSSMAADIAEVCRESLAQQVRQ